jgi:colicin import membrane protein
LSDLRVCGAQTAARHRDRAAAEQAARDRAPSRGPRPRRLADAQLAAVQAQKAAAEAQRRTVEEAAGVSAAPSAEAAVERERQAALDAEQADARAYQEARQRAYDAEAARRRAWEDAPAAGRATRTRAGPRRRRAPTTIRRRSRGIRTPTRGN